jgi:hypothetical protein
MIMARSAGDAVAVRLIISHAVFLLIRSSDANLRAEMRLPMISLMPHTHLRGSNLLL